MIGRTDRPKAALSGTIDVAIFGAGPAGATAAIGLARAGAGVTLFERSTTPSFKPGEIVEPVVRYPLAELGILEAFERLGCLPIAGNLSSWGETEPVEADAMLNPHGTGYLVDRPRMEEWLLAEAARVGVVVIRGVRPIVERGQRWRVRWNEGGEQREMQAGLVVDASGRAAAVIGPGRRERLDQLVALLAYLPEDRRVSRDQRLYIEAEETGWWYSAPLPGGRLVLALMTDADLLPPRPRSSLEFFNARLGATRMTRSRLDGLPVSKVRPYPAISGRREVIGGADWVAIGDAASTYDPLSGRGVAAAMSKGVGLARAIVRSDDLGKAIAAYIGAEEHSYREYLLTRQATYRRETRWQDSPFWQRRA